MSKFYKNLKTGLEEIITYKEGKIELRSTTIKIPEPPTIYRKDTIKKNKDK